MATEPQFELEVSANKGAGSFGRKPHVKKGYYVGKLVDVKPRQKQDGTPVEGKFGKQLVLLFKVYGTKPDEEVGEPVMVPQDDGSLKELVLANVVNYTYKNTDKNGAETGGEHTAVTPNSRITKVFEALGWKFDAGGTLKPMTYLGRFVELNIDDFDATWTLPNGGVEKYKCSQIKDLNKWEGHQPGDFKPKAEGWKSVAQIDARIELLDEMLRDKGISREDYDKHLKQLQEAKRTFEEKV